jgi:hypothetical protein
MKQLIEDYQRRLKNVKQMIADLKFKDDANPDYIRLRTKESCYKTFIAEMERENSKTNSTSETEN